MPPVTPRTIRRPATMLRSPLGRLLRRLGAVRRGVLVRLGRGSTGMILPAATSSKAIDSGLRATEVTCGGMIAPRPSPSWPKYELIWRARLAPRVTRRNFESAASSKVSMAGFIIVSWRPTAMRVLCTSDVSGIPADQPTCWPPTTIDSATASGASIGRSR